MRAISFPHESVYNYIVYIGDNHMAGQVGKPRINDDERQDEAIFFRVAPSFCTFFRELARMDGATQTDLFRRAVRAYGKRKGVSYEPEKDT